MRPAAVGLERVMALGVLAEAVVVMGFALVVVLTYSRALRGSPDRGGLLLWHVIAVATGTAVVFAGLGLATLDLLDVRTPRLLRLSVYLAGGALYLAALWIIANTSRRRVQPQPRTTVVTSDTTVIDPDPDVASREDATDGR